MDKIDLIELLQSFLEEDAIVSRIFSYFCLKKNYNIALLNDIISIGLRENILIIINSSDEQIEYDRIEWKKDNTYQEVVFRNPEKYVLNEKEFARIVLLPQGEFAAFLRENSSQKKETLELKQFLFY